MAPGDIDIKFVGTLTADPELRFTASGAAVASFTVATNPRTKNQDTGKWEDGDPTFIRCSVWREQAERVAECLKRGNRVFVHGVLKQRQYVTGEGEKRSVMEVTAEDVGASLKFKGVTVDQVQREHGGEQRHAPAQDDPWGQPPQSRGGGGFTDEPPF